MVCPQNAKEIADETEARKGAYTSRARPYIASVAPSFIANYDGVGIDGIEGGA